jgi:hypothetical protein
MMVLSPARIVPGRIRRAGEPYALTPTQLMRTMMLSSGGKTKRLDRLADALLPIHLGNEQQLLAPLSPAQHRTLDELLRTLLASLERP